MDVVQGVGRIGPSRVAHGHHGGVAVLDDLDVIAIVQDGEVLVVEPRVLRVLHRSGLGDDLRADEHVPVAERLLEGVLERAVEVGRLHTEGAVLDGLVPRVDQGNRHAAVLVVEVLVEVHAGVEPAELAFIVEEVHQAVVVEGSALGEGGTGHKEAAVEPSVLGSGEEGNALLQSGGLRQGAVESVTAVDRRAVEVVEKGAIARDEHGAVVLHATGDLAGRTVGDAVELRGLQSAVALLVGGAAVHAAENAAVGGHIHGACWGEHHLVHVGVDVEGAGGSAAHAGGLLGLVGRAAAPEGLTADECNAGITLLHAEGEVVASLVVGRADVVSLNARGPNLIPGHTGIGAVEHAAELATRGGEQGEGAGGVVRADGHAATAEALRDGRIVRAAGHRLGGGEVIAAVDATIGRAHEHVAAVVGDFDVLHAGRAGNAAQGVLGEHAVLDVAHALDATVPHTVGHIGVGHQRVRRAEVTALEQAGIGAFHAGPRRAIVGGAVDAVSAETGTAHTADPIELGAGANVEVSVSGHGDGSDHGTGEAADALPVVSLVPGAPEATAHTAGDELELIDGEDAPGPAPEVVGSHGIPVMGRAAARLLGCGDLTGALAELAKALVVHLTGLDVGPQGEHDLLHSGGIGDRRLVLDSARSVFGLGGAVRLEEGQGAGESGSGQKEDSLLHCGSVPFHRKAEFKQGTPADGNRFDDPAHRRVQGA